ncbi:MAG: GAF domain-containing sensor histidine kinase, partial [Chloroflexia bacterium]|nr:GAF domain-containing sensor histidine kinase [Chloroflexia bacterium]
WLTLWIWVPLTAMMILLLPLLFPNGELPSARWRPAAAVTVLAGVLLSASIAINPVSSNSVSEPGNPLFSPGNAGLILALDAVAFPLMVLSLMCAVTAPIVRFRRARGDERQQIKWFAFAAALVIAAMVTPAILDPSSFSEDSFLSGILLATALPLLPAAVGIAVLRYRLYDIDLLINRTIVYVALTSSVVGLYVFVVGYLSVLFQAGGSLLVSLVATGLVAVLFQPLRSWLQLGVNRLLYGQRDEPYTVLSQLGQQLEHALAPEAALVTVVDSVAGALKVPFVAIWLIDEATLSLGAVHGSRPLIDVIDDPGAVEQLHGMPNGLLSEDFEPFGAFVRIITGFGIGLTLPLTNGGELVGALCLAPRHRGDSFSVADRRLLRDLASQAGATAQAVQLTIALRASLDELRRSRGRLVMAQEEERRRIQRDLHDGLGPTLASMRPRLEGCLDLAQDIAPSLVGDLERLDELVGQASVDIRRLVYDLRPPALDQLGLEAALRQYVERFGRETSIRVCFTAGYDLSIPAAAEVALLRIVQEALVNVQKHARATQVIVSLSRQDASLLLEIRDDGVGMPVERSTGTGLGSMRERAELLGGTLWVKNRSDGGAELVAEIPIRS